MFTEAIASIFNHHCSPAAVRAIESGASSQPLTAALEEAGFFELLASEFQGGAGAGWPDFFEVVLLCGARAVPLPLAQTLAARLLTSEPQALPAGCIAFAPVLQRDTDGSLHAPNVPCARTASSVIGMLDNQLLLLSIGKAHAVPSGVHGGLGMSLRWPVGSSHVLRGAPPASALAPLAALLHAGLLAGAMKRCFDLTLSYANARVQFGKPIGRFQAIQHLLSVMAEHVAAGRMAAESAFGNQSGLPTLVACAVAKARTSEAAQLVASTAHSVHGAIGVTEEYDLQLYTRRLHEWRMAHGSETHWHRVLGRFLLDSPQARAVDFVRTVWSGVPT